MKSFSKKNATTPTLGGAGGKPFKAVDLNQLVPMSELMARFQKELISQIKAHLLQSTFSQAAKRRLAQAIQVKVGPKSLTISTKDPAWRVLVDGQKKGQMKWLVKSRTPIPIVTDSGKVIFRSATAKSMSNGKWIHPGRPRQPILEKSKSAAKKIMCEQLRAEIAKQLRAAIR